MTNYTVCNFKTKKSFRESVAKGDINYVYNVGIRGNATIENGTVVVSGPHYPAPHKWWAETTIKDGIVIKVK